MKMATRLLLIVIAGALAALPAGAATSIFPVAVYSSSGATNPLSALGVPDGAAALVAGGGDIVLQFSLPLTGGAIAATLLPVAGVNVIAASIGEIVGGVAVFSGEFVLVDFGGGGVVGGDLSALCATVSASGCSLLKLRNAAALFGSSGFALDGISGVTTAPEPSVWALMILGFLGVAARLKAARRQSRPRPRRSGMLSFA